MRPLQSASAAAARLARRPNVPCGASFPAILRRPALRPTASCSHSAGPNLARAHASKAYSTVSAAELNFGQPVHETHPHVLEPGEVTPGITAQEYADRRARLAARLPEGAAAVLASADLKYRSGAVFYPYRQDSNFLYLTGFAEPDALAVIENTGPELDDYAFHLFARPKDPRAEQWQGPWSGLQAAEDVFNADKAHDIGRVDSILPSLLANATHIYTDLETHRAGKPTKLTGLLPRSAAGAAQPLQPVVNALRAIKSPAEIANMRRAGQSSGRAITEAMRRPWTRERDLAAFLDYNFATAGRDGDAAAYVPVVAGGPRANMIHYVLNNAALQPNELILVDAGGEYGTYVTDITRTWPAAGRFTQPQRELYEAVLRVQRSGVSLCRASAGLSLDQIHRATESALRDQLTALGFDLSRAGSLETLFPHHVGHYVGLDVHDTPGYGRHFPLVEGHCVTVEPGVYVPNVDDPRWPPQYRGMGVRIEDSVCVGEDAPLVLTTEAVKEVDDIEALRG